MQVRSWFPSSSVQTDLLELTRELLQVSVASSMQAACHRLNTTQEVVVSVEL